MHAEEGVGVPKKEWELPRNTESASPSLTDLWLSRFYHTYERFVRRIGLILGGHLVAGGRYQRCLTNLQLR